MYVCLPVLLSTAVLSPELMSLNTCERSAQSGEHELQLHQGSEPESCQAQSEKFWTFDSWLDFML